ncbi:basic helix-loop-helix DNA-binding superfamily protein [Perilla frutescens var. hirtella]|nr:basic helix-loop-helix DNA-binding superfamily protein [Perilla frutescens var. frutescens]KAH6800526.1 basic helix-loop-helix DNA-binding superfamily protein [Perilla frutescens var. hirtella]
MMAGNPNWWSMNGMHPQSQSHQGGIGGGGEEERFGASLFQQQKKVDNWEDQVLNLNPNFTRIHNPVADVKQEVSQIYAADDDEFHPSNSWPRHHQQQPATVIPVSSPTSCVTTLSNSIFNFSASQRKNQLHNQDHSSECNSTGTGTGTGTGGVTKKARVQQSSAQPALKVRKEKLGDRITALHQLVSPFGKTDTASVLSEAIGYIRFLQGQIEALSSPYMRNAAGNTVHHQHSVQERNCLFPQEPSQFLNDIAMEGRGASKQDSQGRSGVKDLRSRGLCLVPISCTQHVGNENGADYWAPAAFGGGF